MPVFSELSFLTGLVLCALYDLFFKKVPDEYQIFLLASGFPLFMDGGGMYGRFVSCVAITVIIMLFYGFIGNFIGGADLKIYLVEIIATGFFKATLSVCVAFVLSGIFALFYVAVNTLFRKKTLKSIKKGTIPFVPFLLISFIITF